MLGKPGEPQGYEEYKEKLLIKRKDNMLSFSNYFEYVGLEGTEEQARQGWCLAGN